MPNNIPDQEQKPSTPSTPPRMYSRVITDHLLWKVACTPPVGLSEELQLETLITQVPPHRKEEFTAIIKELRAILRELYYLIALRDPDNVQKFLPHIILTVVDEALHQEVICGNSDDVQGHHQKCAALRNRIVRFDDQIEKFCRIKESELDRVIEKIDLWQQYLALQIRLIDQGFEVLKEKWPEKSEELHSVLSKKRKYEDKLDTDDSNLAALSALHGSSPSRTPKKMNDNMNSFLKNMTSPASTATSSTSSAPAPKRKNVSQKCLKEEFDFEFDDQALRSRPK